MILLPDNIRYIFNCDIFSSAFQEVYEDFEKSDNDSDVALDVGSDLDKQVNRIVVVKRVRTYNVFEMLAHLN